MALHRVPHMAITADLAELRQYCARYGVYLFCPYPKDRSATQFITQLLSQAKGTSGIN